MIEPTKFPHRYLGVEPGLKSSLRWCCSCGAKGIGRGDETAAQAAFRSHAEGYRGWKEQQQLPVAITITLDPPEPAPITAKCARCPTISGLVQCGKCRDWYCEACDMFLPTSPGLPCQICVNNSRLKRRMEEWGNAKSEE